MYNICMLYTFYIYTLSQSVDHCLLYVMRKGRHILGLLCLTSLSPPRRIKQYRCVGGRGSPEKTYKIFNSAEDNSPDSPALLRASVFQLAMSCCAGHARRRRQPRVGMVLFPMVFLNAS